MTQQTNKEKLDFIREQINTKQELSTEDLAWILDKADKTVELADLMAGVSKNLNTGMVAYRKNATDTALENFEKCQDTLTRSHYWRNQN